MSIYRIICLCFLLTLVACTDPLISIPGGKLKGEVVNVPATWSNVPDTIQFEVNPSNPYSVNICAVVADDHLHVATGNAKWVPFIAEDPNVRVRIDGKIYEMTAARVTDKIAQATVVATYVAKYEVDDTADWMTEGNAYRLSPR